MAWIRSCQLYKQTPNWRENIDVADIFKNKQSTNWTWMKRSNRKTKELQDEMRSLPWWAWAKLATGSVQEATFQNSTYPAPSVLICFRIAASFSFYRHPFELLPFIPSFGLKLGPNLRTAQSPPLRLLMSQVGFWNFWQKKKISQKKSFY